VQNNAMAITALKIIEFFNIISLFFRDHYLLLKVFAFKCNHFEEIHQQLSLITLCNSFTLQIEFLSK
jgi:hypothetical protein